MTKVELLLFTREIRLPGSELADVQARDTKYDIVMHEERRIAAVRLKGGKSKTVLVPMESVLCYIEAEPEPEAKASDLFEGSEELLDQVDMSRVSKAPARKGGKRK